MATALDHTPAAKDRTKDTDSHRDPFGFDLAARCFTEQVRDSMAKISTMDPNAKISEMTKPQQKTDAIDFSKTNDKTMLAYFGGAEGGESKGKQAADASLKKNFPLPWEEHYKAA
jgi:hypothetical protein